MQTTSFPQLLTAATVLTPKQARAAADTGPRPTCFTSSGPGATHQGLTGPSNEAIHAVLSVVNLANVTTHLKPLPPILIASMGAYGIYVHGDDSVSVAHPSFFAPMDRGPKVEPFLLRTLIHELVHSSAAENRVGRHHFPVNPISVDILDPSLPYNTTHDLKALEEIIAEGVAQVITRRHFPDIADQTQAYSVGYIAQYLHSIKTLSPTESYGMLTRQAADVVRALSRSS